MGNSGLVSGCGSRFGIQIQFRIQKGKNSTPIKRTKEDILCVEELDVLFWRVGASHGAAIFEEQSDLNIFNWRFSHFHYQTWNSSKKS
jgi:hypothetical protein